MALAPPPLYLRTVISWLELVFEHENLWSQRSNKEQSNFIVSNLT